MKLEKLFASKESIELLSQLCFPSLLKNGDNGNKEKEKDKEKEKVETGSVKGGKGNHEIQKIRNNDDEDKEKEKEKEKQKEKEKLLDHNIVGRISALPSEVSSIITASVAGAGEGVPLSPLSSSNSNFNSNIPTIQHDAHSQRPAASEVSTAAATASATVSDKMKSSNDKDENINMKKKTHVPLLELDGISLPDDEATIQRNGNLSHNSFLIIKKLSILSPYTLFNNFEFLMNLQLMISTCLTNFEKSNTKRILETNLLPFSGYSIHQRAIVTMEIAHRNANQLKLLCEIIIQYCRSFPSDTHTNFCDKNMNNSNLNQNENTRNVDGTSTNKNKNVNTEINIKTSKESNTTHNNSNDNNSNIKSNIDNDDDNDNNDENVKENVHTAEMFQKMVFSLLPVLTMKTSIIDFTFLSDFLKFEVPMLSCSPSAKKEILRKTFDLVAGKKASIAFKVKIIQVR